MASEPADNGLRHSRRNIRQRADHLMTKGGLVRDDSDDELGLEDLPWEWIFEKDPDAGKAEGVKEYGGSSSRRRTSRPGSKQRRRIVGAHMGSFECRLGQVVLLSSPEPGKDWVGIITEFTEEEDEDGEDEMVKSANIMWFASPDEFMSTRNKRRADALPNEQYITADFNVNPLTSINGKASVMSKDVFFSKYPNGAPPKGNEAIAEYNKCIICRRGVNQVQGRYTEEFVWEDVYREDQVFDLIGMIKGGLKAEAAKKRKQVDSDVSIPTLDKRLTLTWSISTWMRRTMTCHR
jgi:origin recognition complex subunit 1